jgi:hypothetical protein
MKIKKLLLLGAALCSLFTLVNAAHAQGTAFTYQGRLNDRGNPARGAYDFRFKLYADPLGNTQVGGSFVTNAIPVTNGLFLTAIDFGAGIFSGSNHWLEVDVKTNLAGSYTVLTPLQAVTPAPYAIMANSASNLLGTLPAAQLSGTLQDSSLPASPTFSGTVTANAFSGSGANVTGLNPANLSAGTAGINISGNAATATTATSANSATTAGSATTAATANNFSGALSGDVTGTQSATVVSTVGSVTAANVAGGASAANAATSADAANTIVRRDGSGNFSAGTITANLAGNADTATTAASANSVAAANITGTIAPANLPNGLGGSGNTASGGDATAAGGFNNTASGIDSFAAGNQAQATNQGAFVWADSQNAPFNSTNNDSFNVRAQGGVRLVTSGAGMALDGPLSLPTNVTFISSGYTSLHLDNVNFEGNTFLGVAAGFGSAAGEANTGVGDTALGYNTSGTQNSAVGSYALYQNRSGNANSGLGSEALQDNQTGNGNTGIGAIALGNLVGGSGNIALGYLAGINITGSSNIDIGNYGVPGDYGTTRIGTPGIQNNIFIAGVINGNGGGLTNLNASQLTSGTVPSARLSGTYSSAVTFNNTGNSFIGAMQVGADGSAFTQIEAGQATMAGSSSTSKTNLTITFPKAFTATPKVIATVNADPGWNVDDTFVVSVRTVSTTGCEFNIVRVDAATGWSQALRVNWMAWQ